MEYSYVLFDSSQDVKQDEWYAVCDLSRNPFMDLRFISVLENSMASDSQYWCALIYDPQSRPVAAAVFSLYRVDGSLFAPKFIQVMAQATRRILPSFLMFKLLLCGVPVGTGGGQIAAVDDVDWNQLTSALDEIASRLAREQKSILISFKEFDQLFADQLSPLDQLGYHRANSIMAYELRDHFASFDDYYRTRSKRTRANMRKFFGKFDAAGMSYELKKGGQDIESVYTDDVHRLYEAVFDRAEFKFEHLPADFFRELARQFPIESCFTIIRHDDDEEIVGFCAGLASAEAHHLLYCGVNYEHNPQADLYFNLMYRGLENAFRGSPQSVHLGASADEFKKRLGGQPQQLFIYVKAVNGIRGWCVDKVLPYLFD